jgi:PKD repeat protein
MHMRAALPIVGALLITASLSGCLGVDNMAEFKAALGFAPEPLEPLAPIARLRASPTLVGAGQPVTFTTHGSVDPQGSALDAAWDFGDGTTGRGSEVSHRYARAGAYTATLRLTSALGLVGQDSALITVVDNRAPVVAFDVLRGEGPLDLGLAGEELRFLSQAKDPEGQPLAISWDFGDGATALVPEARHAFAKGGRHVVTLRAEDPQGLAASSTRTLAIDQLGRGQGEVAPLRDSMAHVLDVAAGAQRVVVRVDFEALLGANALAVQVVDRDGAVVKQAPAQPPPGTQGAFAAVLELLPADLDGRAPGAWNLVVQRASGLQVGYTFTTEVRY